MLRSSSVSVGLDLGNSHIRVAVGSARGEIAYEVAQEFDVGSSPERALDQAAQMTREAVDAAGYELARVDSAMMGVPAPVDSDSGRIAVNNILPAWVRVHPADEMQGRLGFAVRVENDANLGAVGERARGAGVGHDSMIYVKLATGIGAGLLVAGQLVRGAGGTAGEIGHVQVDPDGILCRCGARGCLETLAALPQLVAAMAPIVEDGLDYAALGRLLDNGNPSARRVVADAGRAIGRTLADISTVLNPSSIVIGGPLTPANEIVAECIRVSINQFAHPMAAARLEVHASPLGDRAAVLGALHLAEMFARTGQATRTLGSERVDLPAL